MTNAMKIAEALQAADDKIQALSTMLRLVAAGAEDLSNGDVIRDVCGHVRENLTDIRAALDEAGCAAMEGVRASA